MFRARPWMRLMPGSLRSVYRIHSSLDRNRARNHAPAKFPRSSPIRAIRRVQRSRRQPARTSPPWSAVFWCMPDPGKKSSDGSKSRLSRKIRFSPFRVRPAVGLEQDDRADRRPLAVAMRRWNYPPEGKLQLRPMPTGAHTVRQYLVSTRPSFFVTSDPRSPKPVCLPYSLIG